jgi:hypothetical protein
VKALEVSQAHPGIANARGTDSHEWPAADSDLRALVVGLPNRCQNNVLCENDGQKHQDPEHEYDEETADTDTNAIIDEAIVVAETHGYKRYHVYSVPEICEQLCLASEMSNVVRKLTFCNSELSEKTYQMAAGYAKK